MFNYKTLLELIGAISLIKEPPITAIWQRYQIGVNITQVSDCPASNETCFIDRVRNGNANVENAIVVATHLLSVSIYCILQMILTLIHFSPKIYCQKNDMYEIEDGIFMIGDIVFPMVIEIGNKVNRR